MNSRVTVRQLEVFLAVAEELNYGRAAIRLHISQPPITRIIQSLEEELSVQLFRRTKREVTLTEAGQSLLAEARRILTTIEQGVELVQAANRGEAGSLHIAFEGIAIFDAIPKAIKQFKETYPNVQVHLHDLPSSEQVGALHDGRVQIALAGGRVSDRKLVSETILRQPYVLIVPSAHPLARLEIVPIASLKDEKLLMCPREHNPVLFDQLISMCSLAGFTPRLIPAPSEMQLILSFIAEGFGFAVAPAAVQKLQMKGITYRPLKPTPTPSELSLTRRKNDESLAVKRFTAILRKLAAAA